MTADQDLLAREPRSQAELEALITSLGLRLEQAVPTIRNLLRERYAAERTLRDARARALIASKAPTVAEKRAEADIATLPQQLEVDLRREALHAAEALQAALTARLNGLLNLNRRGG